jgi:hypothetical protein
VRARGLIWITLLVSASAAAAPDAPVDSATRAKQLKDLGAAALERGDDESALDYFSRAYHAYPSPKLLFNIGLADEGLGRWADAIEAFRLFLADAPDAPASAREHAQASVQRLEPRVGRLMIVVEPADAELTLDETPLQLRGSLLRVMPGAHTLAAAKAGFSPRAEHLEIAAGQSRTVELKLTEAPVPPPTPAVHLAPSPAPVAVIALSAPPPRPHRNKTTIAVAVALSAAAVVGIALGLGFGLGQQGASPSSSTFGVVRGTP